MAHETQLYVSAHTEKAMKFMLKYVASDILMEDWPVSGYFGLGRMLVACLSV